MCFSRATSADLLCVHGQLGSSTVPHQLRIGSLLAASSCHQSCAINLCTPSVRFPICAERRDESGIDGQLRSVKNRKSLGDHLHASLILDADANQFHIPQEHIRRNSCSHLATRELLQTPMHNPVSPTHLPTHNWPGDGQGSREDGHTGKNGKTGETPKQRQTNATMTPPREATPRPPLPLEETWCGGPGPRPAARFVHAHAGVTEPSRVGRETAQASWATLYDTSPSTWRPDVLSMEDSKHLAVPHVSQNAEKTYCAEKSASSKSGSGALSVRTTPTSAVRYRSCVIR